jgi:DNA-binding protein H-NS
MPAFDLNGMTLQELLGLDGRIQATLKATREREHAAFKSELDALITRSGLSLQDVAAIYGFEVSRRSRKGIKVSIKYRNPDNQGQTWTGRGRQPRWLAGLLVAGRKLSDFEV